MSASGLACSFAATASISSGSISGSSPCTLTTMASSGRPSCATASARRSVPVGWSPRVISARTPWAWAACSTRASSVAMQTCAAPERAARSAVRTTMGLPAMSARGLSGRRVEAVRAGIRAMKLTADGSAGGASSSERASPSSMTGMPSRTGKASRSARQTSSACCRSCSRRPLHRGRRDVERRDSMSGILKQFGGRQAGGRGESLMPGRSQPGGSSPPALGRTFNC